MGTSTTIPGSGSMKMPKASRNTLTANRNASGDRCMPTIMAVSSCGTREIVSTQANAADIATMINTEAVISADRARMPGSMAHSSVR